MIGVELRPSTFTVDGAEYWYAEAGDPDADPLLLLHPSGVDARAFAPNLDALGGKFRLILPERTGHGHTPDRVGEISFDDEARATGSLLESLTDRPVRVLGCSGGGIVGLRLAVLRPDLVERLVVVAAPWHVDGWDDGVLDALADDPPQFLVDGYAEVSPDGADHYGVVCGKLARAHAREPAMTPGDLSELGVRTLVMIADDDEVVIEHAAEAVRSLPRGELAIVPGTSHGLLWEKPDLCHAILLDFLRNEPVETIAPRRRNPAEERGMSGP